MGKSTETLRLFINDQRAFRDNIRKSGLGYGGPCVLSQAYAKIPKLYSAYELRDENVQLHVFDSEETLEDAEKSRVKMKEFQKDKKVQELKIKPIDYTNLNNLYETFVPQVKLSLEQKYFSETFISSEDPSNESSLYSFSETKPTNKSMPNVFLSMESDLNETLKQNELLKNRRLEATLAADLKILVITSCVEIRNKNLQDEIERILKELKDVSNKSKTTDTFCNDAFDVTQELSKIIVDLEKYLSKLEAQSIAFEIALQHKSQENNSLKTIQKENVNFLSSLQIENAHLKETYKDLFESVQRSRVENNQCNEVKVKVNFDKIKTQNIELKHQVASLLKENEHLKLVYKNLFDLIKEPRVQKENLKFAINHILGKDDSSPSLITKSNISKLEKESGENICENAKCELQTKIVELEKVLTQKTKDFDDVNIELSNRTAKFKAYFEKLENTKVVLKRQLARKVDDSKAEKDQFLKEINHLKTQLENLKGKSFTPKVVVQKDLSKLVTAQSLSKNEKDQLLKRIASLESKLAAQDIRSCQKEYHELRTSYNALKENFDSLNRTKGKNNVFNSLKPKVEFRRISLTGFRSCTSRSHYQSVSK
ncbi:hypothetical protein Tco_0636101 [Tanacetum coccineum]